MYFLCSSVGGYALYTAHKEKAVAQYKDLTDIGPMRDRELHQFLTAMQHAEQALINADEVHVWLCI